MLEAYFEEIVEDAFMMQGMLAWRGCWALLGYEDAFTIAWVFGMKGVMKIVGRELVWRCRVVERERAQLPWLEFDLLAMPGGSEIPIWVSGVLP